MRRCGPNPHLFSLFDVKYIKFINCAGNAVKKREQGMLNSDLPHIPGKIGVNVS